MEVTILVQQRHLYFCLIWGGGGCASGFNGNSSTGKILWLKNQQTKPQNKPPKAPLQIKLQQFFFYQALQVRKYA